MSGETGVEGGAGAGIVVGCGGRCRLPCRATCGYAGTRTDHTTAALLLFFLSIFADGLGLGVLFF